MAARKKESEWERKIKRQTSAIVDTAMGIDIQSLISSSSHRGSSRPPPLGGAQDDVPCLLEGWFQNWPNLSCVDSESVII